MLIILLFLKTNLFSINLYKLFLSFKLVLNSKSYANFSDEFLIFLTII